MGVSENCREKSLGTRAGGCSGAHIRVAIGHEIGAIGFVSSCLFLYGWFARETLLAFTKLAASRDFTLFSWEIVCPSIGGNLAGPVYSSLRLRFLIEAWVWYLRLVFGHVSRVIHFCRIASSDVLTDGLGSNWLFDGWFLNLVIMFIWCDNVMLWVLCDILKLGLRIVFPNLRLLPKITFIFSLASHEAVYSNKRAFLLL